MSEVLLANLFFIITGLAVLIVSGFVCVLCCYLIKVVRQARAILAKIETGTESLVDDMRALRDHIANGSIFGKVLATIAGAIAAQKTYRKTQRKKNVTNEKV